MTYSPRLFKNTVEGVVKALKEIFTKNTYAHKVVAETLKKNKKWGSRDRSFVAFSTYEIVRHWRFLWAFLGADKEAQNEEKLYQLFGVWWLFQGNTLPDWPQFIPIQNFDIDKAHANVPQQTEVIESFPDWLHQLATSELGDEWPEIAAALNLPAPLCLRINTLKVNREDVEEQLLAEGFHVSAHPDFQDAIFLENAPKIVKHPLHDQGFFEVQDAGSQTISPFLNPMPGETIIDACAGAGGKTLHMAALMQNEGKIIALDVFPKKLSALQKRAKRAGAKIISTEKWHKNAVQKHTETADKLLLDVPCSGTGVIKRDVDTKWKLNEKHLAKNIRIQQQILAEYPKMLKPSGTFVYATCSILKSENEHQIEWLMEKFPGKYELEAQHRLAPTEDNDGFFMARLRKL